MVPAILAASFGPTGPISSFPAHPHQMGGGSVMTSDPGQLQDATKAQPGKTDQKITTRKRSTSGGWVGSVKSLKLSNIFQSYVSFI